MTWLIRMVMTWLRSWKAPAINFNEAFSTTFRVWPTDMDFFGVMNHSRYPVFFEMARWMFAYRTGLHRVAIRERWNIPVAGISVQYYRPLKLFNRFSVKAKIVYWDEKWVVWHFEAYFREKICTEAWVRITFKKGKQTVPVSSVYQQIGIAVSEAPRPNEKLQRFIDSQVL